MNFFKKLFGSKPKKESPIQEITNTSKTNGKLKDEQVPWMTESRLETLRICKENGFKPANSLPTEWERELRPSVEIAQRLHAIKALILWLMVPEKELPNDKILNFVELNELKKFMTEDEVNILNASRDDENLRNAIGWKFENAWPLAWYFGYKEPEIDGEMMIGEQIQDLMLNYTCSLEESLDEWVLKQELLSEESIVQKEDLFYCLHNAVRSAQLGRDTVPNGFDPIVNGGVIHERRHSLTWMLSSGVKWDETELST